MIKTKLFPLLALTLFVGVFLFAGSIAAYAADPPAESTAPPQKTETLAVDEVWLTGDTLHIAVTDKSGGGQTLELNLSDYAESGDEYVTVQAADSDGGTSNSIQFKNPYYVPSEDVPAENGDDVPADSGEPPDETPEQSESAVSGAKPFTPSGQGEVVDDAADGDGKEFFTVETADGNVFYLIVDRQRNSDNVYLLNAVTENDLASLAKPGKSESAAETPPPAAVTPVSEPAPGSTPAPVEKGGNSTGTVAFIAIAVIAVGGAGYYFKIARPKKLGAADEDDYEDEREGGFDDDTEADVESDDEGGNDE
jgi:hypothetical protein